MSSHRFLFRPASASVAAAAAMALVTFAVQAQSPAALACPDFTFLSPNLAINPSFEVPAPTVPDLARTCWGRAGDSFASAADGWLMHTSNGGLTPICSRLVPSDAPGPRGNRMLYIEAGGVEGGIFQNHALDPTRRYMFSIWVKVVAGQVVIASRAMVGGPVAWSSKINEWEQLRVCTNSLANTDALVAYNWAPGGGRFFVDRAELRQLPPRE